MSTLWVVKPEGEGFVGLRASGGRRGWTFSEVRGLEPGELRNRPVLALDTRPQVYFSRETLTKGPREILALQAEDKVRESGFFTGTFRVVFHKLSEGPVNIEVGLLALDPSGAEGLLRRLGEVQARLKGIYHEVLGLAYLVAREDGEPILTARLNEEGLWLVVSERGHPTYMRFQAVDEFLGVEGLPVEENILAVLDYYERFFGKPIRRLFPCGPLRDRLREAGHLEVWTPSLEGFKAREEDILTHPELFGAPFVPGDYNLLPPYHRSFLRGLEWVRYAGAALFAITILNYGLFFHLYRKNRHLDRELRGLSRQLQRNIARLEKGYPPDQVEKLRMYLELKKKFEAQPRMDEFLWWLAQKLPEGVRVKEIRVRREAQGYRLRLSFAFEGRLRPARRAFYSFFEALKERARVEKSRFDYDELSQKASFFLEVRLR